MTRRRDCDGAQGIPCSQRAGDPSPEVCNGVDDNCNGVVDDAPVDVDVACTSGKGGCAVAGVWTSMRLNGVQFWDTGLACRQQQGAKRGTIAVDLTFCGTSCCGEWTSCTDNDRGIVGNDVDGQWFVFARERRGLAVAGTRPVPQSCVETCAARFGGNAADYQCSQSNAFVNRRAYVDGVRSTQFCADQGSGAADTFERGAVYDTNGGEGSAYSAYVNDHESCRDRRNSCWRWQ